MLEIFLGKFILELPEHMEPVISLLIDFIKT